MSCETNWGDGHGGEYWPVLVYHDRRHSWDAAMINDHNYEYIPIRHPKHLMHLAECIIQWPHYFCLILLHASPFSSAIKRFILLAPSGALIAIPTYYWPSTTTHFFRSHRSSTLDFHFLSYYNYIKAIKLYKGNQWTHLLAICNTYYVYLMGTTGQHCEIVQDSER